MMPRRTRGSWRAKLTLLVISLVLSLVLADAVFRLVEHRALTVDETLDREVLDLAALNYNDTTISKSKKDGEFRVLSFGDSFCYSIMKPELSYNGLLEAGLGARIEDGRARVVNLGEPATTVRDYAAGYAFWSERIEHDAVLFNIYLGNDILDVAYSYTPAEWEMNRLFKDLDFHMSDGVKKSPVPRKFPLRFLDHAYALFLSGSSQRSARTVPDERFNAAANDNLSEQKFVETNQIQMITFDVSRVGEIQAGYEAFRSFFVGVSELRERGVRVLVTLAPNEAHVDRELRSRIVDEYDLTPEDYDLSLPARIVLEIRDRVDPEIDVIDLSPYFVCAAEAGEDLYYSTNTHWGPEGNALAGELLTQAVAHLWFDGPEPRLDACDPSRVYAGASRVPDSEIETFVAGLGQLEPPTAAPTPADDGASIRARIDAAINSGSLDGVVFDDEGNAFIWGWARDPRHDVPARSVVVFHNGKPSRESAPASLQRPDVAEFLGVPSLDATGWNLTIAREELTPGENVFEAYALLEDGVYGVLHPVGGAATLVAPEDDG